MLLFRVLFERYLMYSSNFTLEKIAMEIVTTILYACGEDLVERDGSLIVWKGLYIHITEVWDKWEQQCDREMPLLLPFLLLFCRTSCESAPAEGLS